MTAYVEEAAVYYNQGVSTMDPTLRQEAFQSCVAQVHEILQGNFQGGSDAEWRKMYFVGAESCVELENYTLAQKWYRQAIECEPTENCYRGLICAYAFDQNMDEARSVLDEMEKAFPDADVQVSAELIQAELCCLEKDYAASIEHYWNFIGMTNEESLLRRGYMAAHNACLLGGDVFNLDKIAFLEEACQRVPSSLGIFKPLLANAYSLQAALDAEEQQKLWWEKALDAYEGIELVYLGLSDRLNMDQIRINLGHFDQAEADLQELVELYPEDYRIYKQLSGLYLIRFSQTNKTTYRTQAEEAYYKARDCYEKSSIVDESMVKFLSYWQQYVRD